jgi:Zn finger protein HypA/HybF involved in hydrogenase expression
VDVTVTKHRRCPTCGAKAVPILYGLVDVDAFEAEKRGEIAIGGCVIIERESPAWQCTNGHEVGRLQPA